MGEGRSYICRGVRGGIGGVRTVVLKLFEFRVCFLGGLRIGGFARKEKVRLDE